MLTGGCRADGADFATLLVDDGHGACQEEAIVRWRSATSQPASSDVSTHDEPGHGRSSQGLLWAVTGSTYLLLRLLAGDPALDGAFLTRGAMPVEFLGRQPS